MLAPIRLYEQRYSQSALVKSLSAQSCSVVFTSPMPDELLIRKSQIDQNLP
jgi:hypothetical protein